MGQAKLSADGQVSDAQKADLITYLQSLAPTDHVDDTGDALLVVDRAGNQEELLLNRRVSDPVAQRADLKTRADSWNTLLHTGGLLLIGSDGSVEAGAAKTHVLLGEINNAFKGSSGSSGGVETSLEQLIGMPSLAKQLAAAGAPPGDAVTRLANFTPSSTAAEVGLASNVQPLASSTTGSADLQTPQSDKAYIFDYFHEGDTEPPRLAARDQGYTVVSFNIGDARQGEDVLNFFSIAQNGGAGMLYAATHGDFSGLMLGSYDKNLLGSGAAALSAIAGATGMAPSDFKLNITERGGGVLVDPNAINAHWTDKSSFVDLAACHSWFLSAAFGARDFIGAGPSAYGADVSALSAQLYPRMDGVTDSGKKRSVGDAFTAAAGSLNYPGDLSPRPITSLTSPVAEGDLVLHVADTTGATVGQLAKAYGKASDGVYDYESATITSIDATAGTVTLSKPLGQREVFAPQGFAFPQASVSFGSGNSAPFERVGDGNTVLAPAVVSVSPQGHLRSGSAVQGSVHFDAAMQTSVTAAMVVDASGDCHPSVSSAKWTNSRTLGFSLSTSGDGKATVTVHAAQARSADNGTPLDGNTTPPGTSATGPAGDDYSWTVSCSAPARDADIVIATDDCFDEVNTQCHLRGAINVSGTVHLAPTMSYPSGGPSSQCQTLVQVAVGPSAAFRELDVSGDTISPSSLDFGGIQAGGSPFEIDYSLSDCKAAWRMTFVVTSS